MNDPRPDFTSALDALVRHIASHVDELRHVKAERILFVAGAARDTSRATIRPLLEPGMPKVTVDGKARHFDITLRPLFFLDANGLGRLITIFHELFHIDATSPHALDETRRHRGNHRLFDAHVETLARTFADSAPVRLLAPLGHEGEVLMRQWRVRPSTESARRSFTNAHLFLGPIRMHTPERDRTVWW